MLKRGPAFRARSWTWPTQAEAAVGVAAEVTPPTSVSARVSALGVRLLERKERTSFHRGFARYSSTAWGKHYLFRTIKLISIRRLQAIPPLLEGRARDLPVRALAARVRNVFEPDPVQDNQLPCLVWAG